jgi:hypothetical protein
MNFKVKVEKEKQPYRRMQSPDMNTALLRLKPDLREQFCSGTEGRRVVGFRELTRLTMG